MRSPQLPFVSALLAAVLVATAPAAAGPDRRDAERPWQGKLDRRLRAATEQGQGGQFERVIVRTRPGREILVQAQLAKRSRRAQRFGLSLVGGLTTQVTRSELKELAEHPDVEAISADAIVTSQQSSSDSCWTYASSWSNNPCDQAASQYYMLRGSLGYKSSSWDGEGVGVAVIDSGVAPSDDYTITHFYDFTSGLPQATAAVDGYGHGTHVAGLIANRGYRSNGHYQGVAPGARIIGMRVLDNQGRGYTSHVIQAVQFAVANRLLLGVDVINLSLGHPIYESAANDPLVLAVESAVRAGIVVVVSAGNMGTNPQTGAVGYGGITSPGNAPSAITVGAVDLKGTASRGDDVVAPYSSRGPSWVDGFAKPDVVAPGHRLVAPVPSSTTLYQSLTSSRVTPSSNQGSSPHLRLSGTSMAAGVVSGIVATMIEIQRSHVGGTLSPNAIKAILQYSAIPMPGVDHLSQGAGSVNMVGALRLARRANPWSLPGQWWLTSSPGSSTSIEGQSWNWSGSIIWNNHVVWGDTVQYNQLAWATHVVWGDAAGGWGSEVSLSQHVVWGDAVSVWVNHVVWGDSWLGTTDGNHVVWGDSTLDALSIAWKSLYGEVAGLSVEALSEIP